MASTARFDELKKKFDENPRRYFAPLANEFRKSGDAEQAVMICEEFLPQQPGHMSGHIVYGQALFDLGRLDDARTVFETALTLDPENLIALRHLGDIARGHGDQDTARQWYQRVLDADPRNEEVQGLITELDAGGAVSAPPEAASMPPSSVEEAAEPVPSLDLSPASEPAAYVPPPALARAESSLELDVVEEHPLGASAQQPVSSAAEPPFESLSLEGLEPTSAAHAAPSSGAAEGFEPMEFTPPTSAPPAASGIAEHLESGEFNAPSAPVAPLPGLEESAIGAFEARPSAAAPPPLPDFEPMPVVATEAYTDMDAGGADQPPVDIPPEVIAAEAELIDARNELESATAPPELPDVSPSTAPVASSASTARSTPSEAGGRVTPSQPFVTETMAELYVKQGFRDQALDVYKLLLAASPDSQRLRDRIAELQPVPAADAGPNVREFLARIAARRPGDRGASAEPPAMDDFALVDSFDASAPEPSATPGAPSADQVPTVNAPEPAPEPAGEGSIDALFGQRPVGSADASAASALAQAFGSAAEQTPAISGRPARAAAGELSLDSVFRDGGARPPRSAQSFSFDQFFSESAAAERPPEPAPTPTPSQGTGAQGEPPERSPEDIEQFNSWLQGLKQR